MKCLAECVKNFNEPTKQKETFEQLNISMSPLTDYNIDSRNNPLSRRNLNYVNRYIYIDLK